MHEVTSSQDPVPPPIRQPTAGGSEPLTTARVSASGHMAVRGRTNGVYFTPARMIGIVVVLLVVQYAIPYVIERYQYAATRGRQRAEYESATTNLVGLQLAGLSQAYQMVSQQVSPSVVHIDVRSIQTSQDASELDQMYGRRPHELRGQGSGVIVDPNGYLVTNSHVVNGAAEIQVSFADGRVLPATVIGEDALTDLAVLKVVGDNFVAAQWGDSDTMNVGALVWAVGSPFGLQSSITSGIISAKHRAGMAGEVYQDFLQTDAAVNPGNSGGPLVDVQGRVIGINTAIVGDSFQGVSFAIPSTVAQEVYERLKANGRVARGWLGVQLGDVSDQSAARLTLPDTNGAIVLWVIDEPGVSSPAKDAGMQIDDIVIRWNGTMIRKSSDLIRLVAKTEIGSTVAVEVFRRGRTITLPVKIGERVLEDR